MTEVPSCAIGSGSGREEILRLRNGRTPSGEKVAYAEPRFGTIRAMAVSSHAVRSTSLAA
jgi:hypothetical protein